MASNKPKVVKPVTPTAQPKKLTLVEQVEDIKQNMFKSVNDVVFGWLDSEKGNKVTENNMIGMDRKIGLVYKKYVEETDILKKRLEAVEKYLESQGMVVIDDKVVEIEKAK